MWGSGAGPVQDRALTGATKQLPGGDRLELVAARKVKSKNQSFNCCVRLGLTKAAVERGGGYNNSRHYDTEGLNAAFA